MKFDLNQRSLLLSSLSGLLFSSLLCHQMALVMSLNSNSNITEVNEPGIISESSSMAPGEATDTNGTLPKESLWSQKQANNTEWYIEPDPLIPAIKEESPEPVFQIQTTTPWPVYYEFATAYVAPTLAPFERTALTFPDFDMQVVALHTELCGTMCMFPYPEARYRRARACSPCHCDYVCHIYGDCCPDVQLLETVSVELWGFPYTWEETKALSRGRILDTCESVHVKTSEIEEDSLHYCSMINYCPHTNTSGESSLELRSLEAKCENRNHSSHWHYVTPVSSKYGLIYRNRFCAQCHGEVKDNLTAWTINVNCSSQPIATATSAADAYNQALNSDTCDIRFYSQNPPDMIRACKYTHKPVISTCNQTGLWARYDENVERACAMYTSFVHRKYKNAFCYWCNTDLNFEELRYFIDQEKGGGVIGRASFYALLDMDEDEESYEANSNTQVSSFTENKTSSLEDCGSGMIRDSVTCQCRQIQCAPGFHLKGNKCSEVFASSNFFGLAYCSRIVMTAEEKITESMIDDIINDKISMHEDLATQEIQALPRLDCDDARTVTLDLHMSVYSEEPKTIEDLVLAISNSSALFLQSWTSQRNVNMTITEPASSCMDMLAWRRATGNCTTIDETQSLGAKMYRNVYAFGFYEFPHYELTFIPWYNTTSCPHVNLTKAEYEVFRSRFSQSSLSATEITGDVVFSENDTVYLVCVDDYDKLWSGSQCNLSPDVFHTDAMFINETRGFEDSWTIVGVTSLICTCVSLLCLLCVIVSYLLLSPLRAGTGLSTLAMTCLLFLAQTFHEFGIEQFEIHEVCLFLALLIHFLWLSVVFMMTCCTVQLFFAMMYPLKFRVSVASRKILALSLAFSFGLAATVVGLTMLGNYLSYGDLGYPADYLCFVKRSLSRQLAFGLPVGLAVLTNVCLFLVTVTHIRRRPKVSSTRQDQVSLVACFRLSVITGACWLSLFLMVVPGTRPWLEYVFVALLGLQGLLLATTLLVNDRVLNLWREARWCKRRGGKGAASSDRGSQGKAGENTTKALSCVSKGSHSSLTRLSSSPASSLCDLSDLSHANKNKTTPSSLSK